MSKGTQLQFRRIQRLLKKYNSKLVHYSSSNSSAERGEFCPRGLLSWDLYKDVTYMYSKTMANDLNVPIQAIDDLEGGFEDFTFGRNVNSRYYKVGQKLRNLARA